MFIDLIKSKSILLPIFIYWSIQVLLMNLFQIASDSIIMVGIKIVLLIYLVFSFLKKTNSAKINYKNIYFYFIFLMYISAKIILEHSYDFRSIINYSFLLIICLLIFVLCSDLTVSLKELYVFFRLIVYFDIFACIYALIFQTSHFTSVSGLSSAYSNELTSLFISNHEYAISLAVGIIGILFFWDKQKNKIIDIIIMSLLLINLILTFSRSTMIGLLIFILFYIIFTENKKLKFIFVSVISIILLIYLFLPAVQNWTFHILLKENNDAGRFKMWVFIRELFKSLSIENKFLGLGYNTIKDLLQSNFEHSNTHNGFLQILFIYGIIGFVFFIGFLISQIINSYSIYKKNRQYFGYLTGVIFCGIFIMFFNTTILFGSQTDSFLLTVFSVIIPRYVINYLNKY